MPFWAKPPLSTWLEAFCFKLFGIGEFSARLSTFLLMLGVYWFTYFLALRQGDIDHAIMSVLVLSTAGITYITAGAVMPDAALVFSTTLCMVAFWCAYKTKSKLWGYVFFVSLAVGLLTKGLVSFALTMFPIGIWTVWKRQWRAVWEHLPWTSGTALTLILAVPWYIIEEIRSPGFLNYFLFGEHLKKFIESGWAGDLYGHAHSEPRGTIWLFWLVSNLPWSLFFLDLLSKQLSHRNPIKDRFNLTDWTAYLISWALSPMLFFTLAGNIMLTYVLTGVPAFAILAADIWARSTVSLEHSQYVSRSRGILLPAMALVIPLIYLIGIITVGPGLVSKKSQKAIVMKYYSLKTDTKSKLEYEFRIPYSAEFYSQGEAEQSSPDQIEQYFHNGSQDFFVFHSTDLKGLPVATSEKLEQVWQYGNLTLLRERTISDEKSL